MGTENATDSLTFTLSASETFEVHSKELCDLVHSDVVREGAVWRPGRILSSNWKEQSAQVTKFGFFHTFEGKEEVKPSVSVALKGTTVRVKENDRKKNVFAFEISVPNASWFSLTGTPTKHLYKVEHYEDLVLWVKTLKRFQ